MAYDKDSGRTVAVYEEPNHLGQGFFIIFFFFRRKTIARWPARKPKGTIHIQGVGIKRHDRKQMCRKTKQNCRQEGVPQAMAVPTVLVNENSTRNY